MPLRYRRFRRFGIRACRPTFAEIESESRGYIAHGARDSPEARNWRRANGNLDP